MQEVIKYSFILKCWAAGWQKVEISLCCNCHFGHAHFVHILFNLFSHDSCNTHHFHYTSYHFHTSTGFLWNSKILVLQSSHFHFSIHLFLHLRFRHLEFSILPYILLKIMNSLHFIVFCVIHLQNYLVFDVETYMYKLKAAFKVSALPIFSHFWHPLFLYHLKKLIFNEKTNESTYNTKMGHWTTPALPNFDKLYTRST